MNIIKKLFIICLFATSSAGAYETTYIYDISAMWDDPDIVQEVIDVHVTDTGSHDDSTMFRLRRNDVIYEETDKYGNKFLLGSLTLGDAVFEHENVTHDPVYLSGQSGLDDLTASGTYTLDDNAVFQYRIESTGTPDTFEWRKGTSEGWTGPVAMTGGDQVIQDGISIKYLATTGHTFDDEWEQNVGHEMHLNEALHVNADGFFDGNLTIAGILNSLSQLKVRDGIRFIGGALVSTDEPTLTFADATTGIKTLAELAASAVDYNSVTGWREGGRKTINAGDDTKIDIAPGSAQIVDYSDPLNPVSKIISWGQQTALDPALASWTKWVGVKDDGFGEAEFVYQVAFFDEVQRRTIAPLGKVRDQVSGTGPHITNIDVFPRPSHGLLRAFQDFILVFGSFSISGNDVYANGADLLVSKSAGKSYRYNVESVIGHENIHNDAPQTPVSDYTYYVQGSYVTNSLTTIDPNNMDDGAQGIKPVSGGNTYTRQEWYFWPKSGVCNFMYGQTEYASLQEGVDAGKEPLLGVTAIMLDGAIHIASIVIKQGTTEIQPAINAGTAKIIPAGGMGGGAGGGGISSLEEDTNPKITLPNTPIADGDLANGQYQTYVDEVGNIPRIKFKNSVGTVIDRVLDNGLGGSTIIAYWDGRNDPSSASGGFNQAIIAGHASYDAINDLVELTPNLASQKGTLTWQLDQGAGFKAVAEFRISSATGADAMYFYTHSDSVPIGEDAAVGGYIIAIDEYAGNIQLRHNGVELITHTGEDWADNNWHRLEVIINYNMITVSVDGVSKIIYQDVNGRDLSGQYLGFGARTGSITNKHDVRRLELYKGNNDALFVSADGSSIYTSKKLGIGTSDPDRRLHLKGPNANIHIERESESGATFFFSNINGSHTTHWKMEAVHNWGGAGSGSFIISDDGDSSGGPSTPRLNFENGILEVNGYTKLGNDAPAIKVKKFIGSTSFVAGGCVNITHGLTGSKILAATARIDYNGAGWVPNNYTQASGYEANIRWDATYVSLCNHPTSSQNIYNHPYAVLVTYEE